MLVDALVSMATSLAPESLLTGDRTGTNRVLSLRDERSVRP